LTPNLKSRIRAILGMQFAYRQSMSKFGSSLFKGLRGSGQSPEVLKRGETYVI